MTTSTNGVDFLITAAVLYPLTLESENSKSKVGPKKILLGPVIMACGATKVLVASQGLQKSAVRVVRSRKVTSACVPLTSDTYCLERACFAQVYEY